ncbi:MAG: PqqD family protein [Gammaproteobacteria bacterium]|nr:PqqD family protein [Gammaproteobacteria bacterium]
MSTSLDTSQKYLLSERLLPKDSDEDLLVFDPGTLAVHELNSSMKMVARMCDGKHSCEEIVVVFSEQYNLELTEASREVYLALKTLRDQGMFDA